MKFSFPSLGIRFKKAKYYNPFLGCPSGYRKQSGYTRKNGKRVPTRCVHESAERKITKRRRAAAAVKPAEVVQAPHGGGGLMMAGEPAPATTGGGLMSTVRKITSRCPKGYVYRKAYTRRFHTKTRVKGFSVQRKDGTRYKIYPKQKTATVKASCIREKTTERRGRPHVKRTQIASTSPLIDTTECKKLRRGEMFKYNYQYRLPVTARRLALKKAIVDQGPLRVFKKLSLAAKCAKGVKPVASKVFAEDANYVENTYAIGTFIRK